MKNNYLEVMNKQFNGFDSQLKVDGDILFWGKM